MAVGNWQALWNAYARHSHTGPGVPHRPPTIPGAIQAGMILLWNGSVASIPAGWVLCNGANGTPDMRNKFIRGAGGGYGESGAGGVDTHNFVHGHGLSVSVGNAGQHQHITPVSGSNQGGTNDNTDTNQGGGVGNHSHAAIGSTFAGDHGHTVTGVSVDNQLGAVDNRPVFYTLAFIMKT